MNNPKSFYIHLAALALGGATFYLQLKDRSSNNAAPGILQSQREAALANR
jgi:hypothetical protein